MFHCIYSGFMGASATLLNLVIVNLLNRLICVSKTQAFDYLCSWSPNRILVYLSRQFDAVITGY